MSFDVVVCKFQGVGCSVHMALPPYNLVGGGAALQRNMQSRLRTAAQDRNSDVGSCLGLESISHFRDNGHRDKCYHSKP